MLSNEKKYDIEPKSVKVIKGIGVALCFAFVLWLFLSRDTSSPASRNDVIGTWTLQRGSSTGVVEINNDGTYASHVEGPNAAHQEFLDFSKHGTWSWQNGVLVVGDDKGVTLRSFNAKCVNHGGKLRLDQVDYNYYVEFERKK